MDVNWVVDAPLAQLPLGNGDRRAISLERDRHWTYRELRDRRNRYANALLARGVRHGDRVAVLMPNAPEYLALYFAIARLGAICVRLNFRLTAPELRFAVDDSGASTLCVHVDYADRLEPDIVFAADGSSVLDDGALDEPPVARAATDDPVMLMYTSGTTGFPKAAVYTHQTAIDCAVKQVVKWRLDETTVALTPGPLYHAGSFESMLLPALMAGGRAVFLRSGGFEIERLVAVIAAEGVTDAVLFPVMLYDLLRLPGLDPAALASLRRIVTGGDTLMPWVVDAFAERLPDIELIQCFGLTEGVNVTALEWADCRLHPDSIGRPLPLNEVRVVREDGAPAAPDEVGEILIGGAGVVSSYWGRPKETAETFSDGWCRTGDLGRISPDGFLSIAGRKKDMIRSGGENVYPAEVEAVLTAHAAIREAAVIGVPDERYTEVGCAVVVLADGASLDIAGLDAFCRERLAGFKCPKHIVEADSLPRTASGKVVKSQLRDRFRDVGIPASPQPR